MNAPTPCRTHAIPLWMQITCAACLAVMFPGQWGSLLGEKLPAILRGLSFLHGGLPFLVFWAMRKLGYDRRALAGWFVICAGLCVCSAFLLPPAGALLADPRTPRNINQVFGLEDMKPRQWVDPGTYVFLWMAALVVVVAVPAHSFLNNNRKTATA
ncbi:hypothetical protein OVA24_17165 [Luteolibacter sp. SL250]|uniref:hypothetical protein n=1 Tax=Luteolibacter sp. SL250 TaxID=2995170 RepID=UPI0022710BB4|nr:hypothetical protein [Luteolibacter sp. SL250]WAC18964.1 hypothetical protein OVA24_17165 [Luteolibacter sp. SL250]